MGKFFNGLSSITILTVTIIISFAHTILLFERGGYEGWLAILATTMAEVGFVSSTLNVLVHRSRKQKPGSGPWLGMLLGLSIVLTSNIRAGLDAPSQILGIILGAVIPCWLIISEMTFSQAVMKRKEANEQPIRQPEEISDNISQPNSQIEYVSANAFSQQEVADSQTLSEPMAEMAERSNAPEELAKIANQILMDTGRVPSQRALALAGNTSRYQAGRVLKQLGLWGG